MGEAPDRIFLWFREPAHPIAWSQPQVDDKGEPWPEYVRADLHAALEAQVAALTAERDEAVRAAAMAGAPLEAIILSGTIHDLAPSLQEGIREGVKVVRSFLPALARTDEQERP